MGVALPIASLALSAVSTGVGFLGQMQQQQAQAQQAQINQANLNYQAQVQRNNAALAERQAADALQRGRVEEDKRRMLTQQQIGQQQARLAAQGTDLEGSPTDILGDTSATGELDALTIRSNAAREAYGYRIQASNYESDATLKTSSAANSSYSPNYLGAGASLLAGASNLGERWWRFQQNNPSGYSLSRDTLRTAGDRDLAGYG